MPTLSSQLISQEPNQGVDYEYYLPNGRSRDGYYWSFGSWSACSRECGSGLSIKHLNMPACKLELVKKVFFILPPVKLKQVVLFFHQATSLAWSSAPSITSPTPIICAHLCQGHRPTVHATPSHAHRAAGNLQPHLTAKIRRLNRLWQDFIRSTASRVHFCSIVS